ncbi:MAG: AAA family ATPase [Nanoarchaeota archaeon]|nr:AAA family ATPase [Nanoarchaeota archaeon]MBU1598389.1 AAA family ATPase [Nanoarchaeota archaeon]MBU2440766.1 AAA family ATPase [Nanoarchaeota archaeon]
MIIFLTAISETDKYGFIDETIKLAKKNGITLKHISLGSLLMKQLESDLGATFVKKNVLNIDSEFRALVIKNIMHTVKEEIKKHKHVIVSTHATFFWKKNFTNAFNWKYLKVIKPDMYITLIHNSDSIQKRMKTNAQWKDQNMKTHEILAWQNVEVNVTSGWAQLMNKPHYILPRRESEDLLFKLMFIPKAELVYASFPMSNIKSKADEKRIDDFIKNLQNYFAVLNPRSIELSKNFNEEQAAQTYERDLRWFTGKAKKIIVYYLPSLVFSAGVMTEINHAFDTTKEIWMISPDKFYGPFEKHMINKFFHSDKDFFDFLKKKGYAPFNIKK